ncbi:SRPBCC family protein [Amycolatopsis sp.]|jgi:hypothetical protein|uniref:SRPBCC family protein n=1 Tax=Amycolatopsis sp. TaxID=37632 RepID=UPI002DFA3B7F|nr:SRPBCC family protein [Amycolatopsis sp.]
MPTYRHSARADIPADDLFAFLSEARNLPRYFPRLAVAEPGGGDEVRVEAELEARRGPGRAWLHTDAQLRTLSWGTENEDDYHGELHIGASDAESCEITVILHTERTDGDEVRRGLAETVAAIARTASEDRQSGRV